MLIYWFTYWLGRPEDFAPTMGLFLVMVVVALPGWNAPGTTRGEAHDLPPGLLSWIGSCTLLYLATPEWPTWTVFAFSAAGGIGYAAADMIPLVDARRGRRRGRVAQR